jgi:hypothetical protein
MNFMSPRPRALLGWELGAGLEHIRRVLHVAKALAEEGWEPVLALRDLATAPQVLESGFRALQAPIAPSLIVGLPKWRGGSYGEIVSSVGFGDPLATMAMLSAWDEIFTFIKPSVVIADYSPFLSLAAYGRVPLISIGDGFVLPPGHLDHFPLLHPGGTRPFDHDQTLVELNQIQRKRGAPELPNVPAVIAGTAQIVCTYPELDVYRKYRQTPAAGPFVRQASPLPNVPAPKIFFYLAADYRLTWNVIEALAASGVDAHGFVRSATEERKKPFAERGLHFYDRPLPIADALAQSSAVIHHGGVGTSEAVMAAGRPQLLVPRHLEQTLNAKSIMSLGAGIVLVSPFTIEAAQNAIKGLLKPGKIYNGAEQLSARLNTREYGKSLELVLASCRQAISAAAAR